MYRQWVAPSSREERTWAMICHLAAFAGYIIPFGHIIGPLVVWLLKRDELPAVDFHGKEALNFQLSMTIYMLIAGLLYLVYIGIPIYIGLAILHIAMITIAAVKAYGGEYFRYPLSMRLVR